MLSLVFSALALAISAAVALRQLRLARHTNLLPVMIDMFQEFRQPEFKEHLAYIQDRLWDECPPQDSAGWPLPPAAWVHVAPATSFFNTVGLLVAHGVIDEIVPASYMGGSILRTWSRLAPYVHRERERRQDPNYLGFFEHLAFLAHRNPPSRLAVKLKLHRMPSSQ